MNPMKLARECGADGLPVDSLRVALDALKAMVDINTVWLRENAATVPHLVASIESDSAKWNKAAEAIRALLPEERGCGQINQVYQQ